jgi:curved DNA-binding protein CbpA
MMTNEQSRERCLEALGLEPGASAQEIKSAYRDLAKVWHPDRFTHDPRLQQKAQEQLKEINDAYRQLLTGQSYARSRHATQRTDTTRDDATRDTNTTRDARCETHEDDDAVRASRRDARHSPRKDAPPQARRKIGWLALASALAFCATFAFFTPRLLSSRVASLSHDNSAAVAPTRDQPADEARQATDEDNAAQKSLRKQKPTDAAARPDSSASTDATSDKIAEAATMPTRALATINVAIDPATGLRARAECPNRMIVTFPAGEEPRAYCNAEHHRSEPNAATTGDKPASKSRLKSFAGRLASPSKWFADKTPTSAPAKKSAVQDQSPAQD